MIPYGLQNVSQFDWDKNYPLTKTLYTLMETMGCWTMRLE